MTVMYYVLCIDCDGAMSKVIGLTIEYPSLMLNI